MANADRIARRLVFLGVFTGICVGVNQVVSKVAPAPAPAPVVAAAPQPEVIQPAPVAEVAAPSPEYANEAERVKAAATDHMAQSLLERCEQDWLPSTCVQMRAELEAASR